MESFRGAVLAAIDRRRLLSGASLVTGLGTVSFPLAEAALAESQAPQSHLAEVPLASGATLSAERRGQVALFGINRPQIQTASTPRPFGRRRRPTLAHPRFSGGSCRPGRGPAAIYEGR